MVEMYVYMALCVIAGYALGKLSSKEDLDLAFKVYKGAVRERQRVLHVLKVLEDQKRKEEDNEL